MKQSNAAKSTKTTTKSKTNLKVVKSTKSTTKSTKKPKIVEVANKIVEELSFKTQVNKLPEKLREKISKALIDLNIKSLDELKIFGKYMDNLKKLPGNFNYVIIDISSDEPRYEITNIDFTKVYKNRSCGTWKRIIDNKNVFVYTF